MVNRLLIVDDALIMRMKIRKIAEQAGWTVVGEASNGEDGVQMYQEYTPDLVTLDMVMPKLDGVGTLKAIRAADPDSAAKRAAPRAPRVRREPEQTADR